MTVSSGSSADRRARRLAVAVTAAGLLAAGCSGSQEADVSKSPKSRPDEQVRTGLSSALTRLGRTGEARIVTAGGSRLTPMAAPFLKSWRVYQVDYRQSSRPVMFHVALGGSQAYLLTGDPAAFGKMTKADGSSVGEATTAAAVATLYVQTTRPSGKLSYVVNGVDQIKFRPNISGSAAARRDQIVSEYRPVIKPPAAVPKGRDFAVTVHVVRDRELIRRDLTISPRGDVEDKPKTVVSDLPVPYVL
ncbi:hypothetical protein [Spirillospora sp. CA-294931]|uniref:hypothetical protein n=1 Tax=Spirillospora sp. CA-294931 TaxID=3240042 RepID=UPI003D92CB5B